MKRSTEPQTLPSAANLLRGTLTLKLLAPTIAAVFLLGAALLMENANTLSATNNRLGAALARYIEIYISDAREQLQSLAQTGTTADPPQIHLAMRQAKDSMRRFERLVLIDAQRRVLYSYPTGFVGVDFPVLFPDGVEKTISRPIYSDETGLQTIFMQAPIPGAGMMVGELTLEGLRQHIQHFSDSLPGTEFILTDSYGNLIAHPDMRLVRRQTNIGDWSIFQQANDAGHHSAIGWRDGRLVSETMVILPGHGWRLVLATDLWTVLSEPLKLILILEFLLVAYFAGVAIVVSRTLRKKIIRPMVQFSRSMTAVAAADQVAEAAPAEFQELDIIRHEFDRALSTIREREKQLRESRALLEQAQQIAHVGSWRLDMATDELTWSDETRRIFDLSAEDTVGTSAAFFALVHPEDRAAVQAAFVASTQDGQDIFDLEHRILRPSGEIRHVHERSIHERDASGTIVRSIGMVQDITDRKEAKAMLTMIMDTIPAQIHVMDPQTHDVLFANKRTQEDYGEACAGAKCWQLFRNRSEPCEGCPLNALLAADAPDTIIWEEQNTVTGKTLVNMDTLIRWMDGRLVKLQVSTDVSDLRRAEAALLESEKRFRAVLEDIQMVAVQGYDQERRVTYWNKASEMLYGYSREEATGRKLEDLIIPEPMRDEVIGLIQRWLHDGPAIPAGNLELRHKDGSPVPVHSSHVLLETSTGNKEMFCIDIDHSEIQATHRRLAQARDQAEAANRAKSEFLANMSHEIRTPLNGIQGMLQLLEASGLDDEQREFCALGIQSTRRLTALLSDILDLSRVEAGKLLIRAERFHLPETLAQAIDLFQPVAVQTGVQLTHAFGQTLPAWVVGDAIRLQQVLTNLIGNAFKFTRSGHVHIDAFPLPSPPGRVRVLFSVSDTGCGIAEADIESLFRPFSQVSQGYTRNHQGAGLGLAISKQLVALMDGAMFVESEHGVGTTFSFCVTFGEAVSLGSTQRAAARSTADAGSLHILLAEDEEMSLFGLTRLLQKSGHSVAPARNGQEVLHLHATQDFDLILMDVQMPVMDGVEATRHIRENGAPRKRTVPIIALTAYAMAGDREKFLAAGMNGYLSKPVEMDELLRTILQITSRP